MSRATPTPRRCIHLKPTAKSVLFCGEFLHLPTIAMLTGYSVAYISYVFSHKKGPSLVAAEKIAAALKMGLEEFLRGLRGHVKRRYIKRKVKDEEAA